MSKKDPKSLFISQGLLIIFGFFGILSLSGTFRIVTGGLVYANAADIAELWLSGAFIIILAGLLYSYSLKRRDQKEKCLSWLTFCFRAIVCWFIFGLIVIAFQIGQLANSFT